MKVIELFPNIADAPTFKGEPWKLSDATRARLEEMERHQQRARATAHLYWFD